jgi:hypothetical protein
LAASSSEADWRWRGYLAVGCFTLLTALWKAGKTTLLVHLIKALEEDGYFCDQKTTPCGVLVVSEEPAKLWVERRDRLTIGDHALFLIRPFRGRPDYLTWREFILYLEAIVKGEGIGLVILDTLTRFWPVADENNAAEVLNALAPLHILTEAGTALLVTHHPRKSDGQEGTAARGSGALAGFVDIIMELRRFAPGNRKDRRRTITAYGRYTETPDELVVGLSEDGLSYSGQGDRGDATYKQRAEFITFILPNNPPGMVVDDILEAWPDDPKPSKRTLEQTLGQGVDRGDWKREGTGKRGDPYRYLSKGVP